MSVVLSYFKTHQTHYDPLHMELSKIPEYQARFPAILHEMLSCCGAQEKSGKVVVINYQRWNQLAQEQSEIVHKLRALDILVTKLDQIFNEVEKAGFKIYHKTVRGLLDAEDRDPRFVEWLARAEGAMVEAGLRCTFYHT
jgi:hypothetical protein